MYTELSANQAAALEHAQCGKCGEKDSMAKEWTRNGLTVKCTKCGESVKRPRGRAVAKARGQAGHAPGEGSQAETPEQAKVREQQEQEQYEKERQDLLDNMQRMVDKAVREKPPTIIKVEHPQPNGDVSTVEVESPHPLLGELLRRVQAGIRNFLLVGPSGSGKTTLLEQLAKALQCLYSLTPMSGGLTEGKLIGRVTANGEYLTTAFVTAYEQASVHNLDEFDKSDPNVPACIHSAIENGRLFLPDRTKAPVATRHPLAILGATANTWGVGANMLYVGANQIDAAMKSRFAGGMFFVDYDVNLEASLVPEAPYRDTFWLIRKRHSEHNLRRIWGTRELLRGALLLRHGYSMGEVFGALTAGYTPDELQKVGVA